MLLAYGSATSLGHSCCFIIKILQGVCCRTSCALETRQVVQDRLMQKDHAGVSNRVNRGLCRSRLLRSITRGSNEAGAHLPGRCVASGRDFPNDQSRNHCVYRDRLASHNGNFEFWWCTTVDPPLFVGSLLSPIICKSCICFTRPVLRWRLECWR